MRPPFRLVASSRDRCFLPRVRHQCWCSVWHEDVEKPGYCRYCRLPFVYVGEDAE